LEVTVPDLFEPLPWNDGPGGGTPASVARGPRRWEAGIEALDVQGDSHDERIGSIETVLDALFSSAQAGTTAGRPSPVAGRLYVDLDLPALLIGTGVAWLKVDLTALTGGGAALAPQNFTGTVVAGGSIGEIDLTWDAVPGATAVTVRESRSPNGVSGMPLAGGATSSNRTPSTPGGYDYWVTATVGGVETAISNHFTCTLPFSGTVGTPGEILNIGSGVSQVHANIGIGFSGGHPGPNGETAHTDTPMTASLPKAPLGINDGYAPAGFWTPNSDGTAVSFTIYADGSYTSPVNPTTHHPRTELRELNADGTKASWAAATGTHVGIGRTVIKHLPADAEASGTARPWICFAQIHDGLGDVVRLQVGGTMTGGLTLRVYPHTPNGGAADPSPSSTLIKSTYAIDEIIDWKIEVTSGICRIYLSDVLKYTINGLTATGCYFKAGNYQQFSTLTTDGGYAASSYSTVELSNLSWTHS
jgi:hypothetical protein